MYSVSRNIAGVNTAGTVLAELRAGAGARLVIREIGISIRVASTTAAALVLARPTNSPAGGTAITPQKHDNADGASGAVFYTAGWTTTPTFTTTGDWYRIAGLPLTVGAGVIWTFPDQGLVIPTGGSLLFANLNASGTTTGSFDFYATWSE